MNSILLKMQFYGTVLIAGIKNWIGVIFMRVTYYCRNKSIIDAIGNHYFENTTDFLYLLHYASQNSCAVYYRFIGYTKMDRILSSYIKYLTQKGMKIYLITDEDAPEKSNTYGTAIVPYLCFNKC
jgi:hypothetical protein